MSDIKTLIIAELEKIIAAKGEACPDIVGETRFLQDLPMDSLDLATLLVTLELETGKDPFRDGFKGFQTLNELSALYQAA
ncbi:hypothetical protein L2725_04545 [Shewanella corallii]|uniref:Carrier domain-containing protein n=2 Tax=Shewanella TaxID=22 RepID=A0ABT0N4F2_9GAMM|nr:MULTISPECIES: hypothetical protein [Shewanella]MCL1036429.1 hypothetical protein [Shewanella submarina]MCL2913055.1 hypothetical protein [Shewanella corallii]